MSTAALAADALASRRAPEAVPPRTPSNRSTRHLTAVPAARAAAPTDRAASPAVKPAPAVAPRRRPRVDGTTTDPLSVRGCSGEVVGRHTQARPEPAPLRLTRRGRLLVTALSVLVFGSAIVVLGLRVAGVLEPGPHFTHTVPVQVAPGQTLWSIAQSTNPGQDPGTVVEKIADLNKLSSPASITPGQTLQVPVAG
ncbi:LysM peptidoglycan-binding domain-containing protein [Kribbella sp. NPDC004875]|uniref:LysM peptidoglycan-binding domain-containing protein n=1 Tax=Kribbella sp. NPDC004875 TaxID=3364107 RepID=UPI0036C80C9E